MAALHKEVSVYGAGVHPQERSAKQERLSKLYREQWPIVRAKCDSIFKDPTLGPYFRELGTTLRDVIIRFLRILKTSYGQTLLPDLPVLTANTYWTLPDGLTRSVEDTLLDRLLSLRSWADAGDHVRPIEPTDWPRIGEALADNREPPFSEVLLASALGQCDPDLGNPRLAVIEAICALEIEVRDLLSLKLESLGLSSSAADRVMIVNPLFHVNGQDSHPFQGGWHRPFARSTQRNCQRDSGSAPYRSPPRPQEDEYWACAEGRGGGGEGGQSSS
jgi:hypothetical protein